MIAARQEDRSSTNRISGRLVFLVNNEWALTDRGLEGVKSAYVLAPGRNVSGRWVGVDIKESACPMNCDPDLWNEAQYYMSRLARLSGDRYRSR